MPRLLARICFWLCLLPAIVGAVTIPLAPQLIAHYRQGLATPGTDAYHNDCQRALITTIGNLVVRSIAIPLVAAFAAITIWPRRGLQLPVFSIAVLLAIAHLALPIVRAGPLMMLSWLSPFYFLPAASGVLSAYALYVLFARAPHNA